MRRTTLLPLLLLALCALLPSSVARAESRETDAITLGWMTEHSDLVAVLAPTSDGDARDVRRVESIVRGSLAVVGDVVALVARDDDALPAGRTLAFLVRRDATWVPVSGGHALKGIPDDGTESALLAHTRSYASFLDDEGRVARGDAQHAFLLRELASPESGLPFSAGRDLVRHRELLTSVTTDERHAATAPLMIDRKADQDLASLVRVAGVMGDERATARLVSILLAPTTRTLRTHLSWALVQRASLPDADVIDRLDAALGEASPAQREDVCVALGALCEAGTPDAPRAEAPLTTLLRDPARPVRAVAAHGLGLLARAVRRAPAPGEAEPQGGRAHLSNALEPLRRTVVDADTSNERRAALWAIAQIDTAEAWAQLDAFANDAAADDDVRAMATQYRRAPRTALVLER
jgi:hypothetical protein